MWGHSMISWFALLILSLIVLAGVLMIISPRLSIRLTYPEGSIIRQGLEAKLASGSRFIEFRIGGLIMILFAGRIIIAIARSLVSSHR
jgi:hypothetical protein